MMSQTGPVVTQAGAIAFKIVEAGPMVLLVRAKKNPSHWIFPKGHVEPGETLEQTATRELGEEAGVEGEVVRPAGALDFRLNGNSYHVTYFLLRYLATKGGGEAGRDPRWCTVEEALGLISFPDMREMLLRMNLFINKQ
jgi:ADP-ribose pyrophosphatase YjhB (NUDIX family)